SEKLPVLATVRALVKTNSGVRIGREVGFARADVDRFGILLIDRQSADVQNVLIAPACSPSLTGIVAAPNAAAGGSGVKPFRMDRMTRERGNASADIRRANALPRSRDVRGRRERFLDAIAFANQRMHGRFTDRPGAARLKPAAANFVMRETDLAAALLSTAVIFGSVV